MWPGYFGAGNVSNQFTRRVIWWKSSELSVAPTARAAEMLRSRRLVLFPSQWRLMPRRIPWSQIDGKSTVPTVWSVMSKCASTFNGLKVSTRPGPEWRTAVRPAEVLIELPQAVLGLRNHGETPERALPQESRPGKRWLIAFRSVSALNRLSWPARRRKSMYSSIR